jgi:uncharacterized protein involved in tolerance to divalent cations
MVSLRCRRLWLHANTNVVAIVTMHAIYSWNEIADRQKEAMMLSITEVAQKVKDLRACSQEEEPLPPVAVPHAHTAARRHQPQGD